MIKRRLKSVISTRLKMDDRHVDYEGSITVDVYKVNPDHVVAILREITSEPNGYDSDRGDIDVDLGDSIWHVYREVNAKDRDKVQVFDIILN